MRTLIATLVGLAGFIAYVALVVRLGDLVVGAGWPVQALYFLVVGTVWVVPVWSLMLWAARA